MNITIEDKDSARRLIRLEGRLDLNGHDKIDDQLTEACTEGPMFIVLDISELSFLATIGIRLIAMSARSQEELGGKLVLSAPQPHIRRAIEITGVDALVPIFDDTESALESVTIE